jgi:hypothetical protein
MTVDPTKYRRCEMNTMPGFTAEASLYRTGGLYCMATAFNSQNASANVQPAIRPDRFCRQALHAWSVADPGSGWEEFWMGAYIGAGCAD